MNLPSPERLPSLANLRVLVGRARHQAGALSEQLRALGAEVIEIPFIEIRPPRSYRPLDEALQEKVWELEPDPPQTAGQ